MNKYVKANLVQLMEMIEPLTAAIETAQNDFGHNLKAMNVEHEEIGMLKFDLDRIETDLSNLADYINQYIKEEEEYEKAES